MDHHKIWIEVQKYSIIPSFILLIYKIVYGPWNLNKFYYEETVDSYLEFFKVYNLKLPKLSIKAIEKNKENKINKDFYKRSIIDDLFLIYILTGIIYYFIDIYDKLYNIGVFNWGICDLIFFLHHILSIISLKVLYCMNYYTLYHMFPTVVHSVYVGLPKLYLKEVIYGFSLFMFTCQFLFHKTAFSTKSQRFLFICILIFIFISSSIFLCKCEAD